MTNVITKWTEAAKLLYHQDLLLYHACLIITISAN
jgi:hypothetical protein